MDEEYDILGQWNICITRDLTLIIVAISSHAKLCSIESKCVVSPEILTGRHCCCLLSNFFSERNEPSALMDAGAIFLACDTAAFHENSWSWWRHQMEKFSALLAFCAGNSPVAGEFPTQRPATRSFDVFFDLRLNKRLSKQSWGWWFETLACSLWRHCNVQAPFFRPVTL